MINELGIGEKQLMVQKKELENKIFELIEFAETVIFEYFSRVMTRTADFV